MSRRLFDLAGLLPAYPGTDGISGIMLRYLSTDLLNVSTETSVRSLISGKGVKESGSPDGEAVLSYCGNFSGATCVADWRDIAVDTSTFTFNGGHWVDG